MSFTLKARIRDISSHTEKLPEPVSKADGFTSIVTCEYLTCRLLLGHHFSKAQGGVLQCPAFSNQ